MKDVTDPQGGPNFWSTLGQRSSLPPPELRGVLSDVDRVLVESAIGYNAVTYSRVVEELVGVIERLSGEELL